MFSEGSPRGYKYDSFGFDDHQHHEDHDDCQSLHTNLASHVAYSRDDKMMEYFNQKLRRLDHKFHIRGGKTRKINKERRVKLITLLRKYYSDKTIDRFLMTLTDQKSYGEMIEKIKNRIIPHAKLKDLEDNKDIFLLINPIDLETGN